MYAQKKNRSEGLTKQKDQAKITRNRSARSRLSIDDCTISLYLAPKQRAALHTNATAVLLGIAEAESKIGSSSGEQPKDTDKRSLERAKWVVKHAESKANHLSNVFGGPTRHLPEHTAPGTEAEQIPSTTYIVEAWTTAAWAIQAEAATGRFREQYWLDHLASLERETAFVVKFDRQNKLRSQHKNLLKRIDKNRTQLFRLTGEFRKYQKAYQQIASAVNAVDTLEKVLLALSNLIRVGFSDQPVARLMSKYVSELSKAVAHIEKGIGKIAKEKIDELQDFQEMETGTRTLKELATKISMLAQNLQEDVLELKLVEMEMGFE